MNELYFPNPIIYQRLRTGPLGGHIDAFVKHLSNEGYALWTIKYSMRLLADFTTWMQQQQVVIADLAEQPVNTFFQQRYQTLHPHRDDRSILVKLLAYLRMTEIIVEPIKVVDNPAIDNMLQEFRQHLIEQRNLAPITIQTYLRMKTTLELPDELARRIKIRAAERNQKLKEIIAQLLEFGLANLPENEVPPRTFKPVRLKRQALITIEDIESAIAGGRD